MPYSSALKLENLTFDEVNAVLHHKWILSEKEGRDVGMEYAMRDFFQNQAAEWRKKKLAEDVVAQKEEILKHKWFMSEKSGHDVGNTEAALDWVRSGFAEQWRNRTGPYKDRK
jgi:hypothetical protein